MSLKHKLISTLAAGAATFAFSVAVMAQDSSAPAASGDKKTKIEGREGRVRGERKADRGYGRHHGRMGGLRMMHGLDLTEAQKAQMKSLMEANKPSQELREEMRTLAIAKRDGTITADQQSRLIALKQDAEVKKQSLHTQMLAILTQEQRQKLEERKAAMKQRMEERKKRMQERKLQRQQRTEGTGTSTTTKDN